MAAASSPTSGHSSQGIVLLSGEARARMNKYTNELRDDLDNPALKTDAAFRKILAGCFFKFIDLESQALTVTEKEECHQTYPLNKRLFNHEGTPSSFVVEEIRLNKRSRSDIPGPPVSIRSPGPRTPVASVSVPPPIPPIAFGKVKWKEWLSFDIGEEPPLPANIEEILDRDDPYSGVRKLRDTHLLFLVPAKIDGEDFTVKLFEKQLGLLRDPPRVQVNQSSGQSEVCRYSAEYEQIRKFWREEKIHQSYWVLMTKEAVPRSQNKSFPDQLSLITAHNSRMGASYGLPRTIEGVLWLLIMYFESGRSPCENLWFSTCDPLSSQVVTFGSLTHRNVDIGLNPLPCHNVGAVAVWRL